MSNASQNMLNTYGLAQNDGTLFPNKIIHIFIIQSMFQNLKLTCANLGIVKLIQILGFI